jgi:hypothetical protein
MYLLGSFPRVKAFPMQIQQIDEDFGFTGIVFSLEIGFVGPGSYQSTVL